MESQPKNPESGSILKTFTHANVGDIAQIEKFFIKLMLIYSKS